MGKVIQKNRMNMSLRVCNEKVLVRIVGWMEYTLKFRAKNMTVDGNPVEVFQVTGDELIGGNLNIHKCTLLE